MFINNRKKKKAEVYLKEKQVMSLVNYLTSALFIHEPDDPETFLVHQLEAMINFRDNQDVPPILFNNDHLVNVFKGIDFLNIGSIDLKQYFSGKFSFFKVLVINTRWKYLFKNKNTFKIFFKYFPKNVYTTNTNTFFILFLKVIFYIKDI